MKSRGVGTWSRATADSRGGPELPELRELFRGHDGNGRLILFEGMPGAGKTSVARALATSRGARLLEELDHVAAGPWSGGGEWYLEAEAERQEAIRGELARGREVFQDRGILSTIAFARALESRNDAKSEASVGEERLLWGEVQSFVRPDCVVVFDVDCDVSITRRAAARDDARYGIWYERSFLLAYQNVWRWLPGLAGFREHRVDSTEMSGAAVRRVVEGMLTEDGFRVALETQ